MSEECKNCGHKIDEDGAGVQHVFYNPKSEMIKGQCMDTWSKKCICGCSKPEKRFVGGKKNECTN